MASVLTITPNPSNIGDTVAVATTGSDPSTFPLVASDYNFSDLTPFFPLSPFEGMVINVTSPASMDFIDNGGFNFSYSQNIIYSNEPISIDYTRQNGERYAGITLIGTDSGGTDFTIFSILSLNFTNVMRVQDTNGFQDFAATLLTDIDFHYENDGSGNSVITIKEGVTTIYSATSALNDISSAETIRISVASDVSTAPIDITNFNIGLFYPVANWSLTQDTVEITSGTTTTGVISYDHTAQISDNNTDWKYIVDGVDSNIVTMLVESGSYYTPLTPFSCTLKLAMEIRKGYANTNSIFDWGSTADTYKTDATYISEGYTIWDRPTANVPETNLNVNGFYPFGNLFASNVAGYRYPVYQGKANFHGAFHSWAVELIPDSSAGYTYDTSPWVARNVTGFSIGALVNFPFPNCTPEAEYSISYNRIGNIVREYDSGEASEHRPFSMQWNNLCGEDLRGILTQLITVVRGNSFTVSAGTSLARLGSWLPREGEALSGVFNVRLVSPLIEYTCTGEDLWSLEIKVMKWES